MLSIQADWTELSRYLDRARTKQLPYVTARATTRLAQKAQQYTRANLGKHFTIRSGWVARGIRVQRAEKHDWPAIQAIVGSIDWFMEAQETGRDRMPHAGHKDLPVPGADLRPTKSTKIPRSKWPKQLLAKRGTRPFFLAKIRKGMRAGEVAVLRRSTSERYPLQVLYVMKKKTKGAPRFHLEQTARAVVRQFYTRYFNEEMERALQPRAIAH